MGEGELVVERDDGSTFIVGIERLHLEQDAGKSIQRHGTPTGPMWT